MIVAAYLHDNGWWMWDLQPHIDSDEKPMEHIGVPKDDWIDFYNRGIDNVAKIDPYAELLVSMHASGLRRQRYATRLSQPNQQEEYAEFVNHQEESQQEILSQLQRSKVYDSYVTEEDQEVLRQLHESGDSDPLKGRIWFNYRLLQAWDRLSLYLTTNSPLEEQIIEPVPTQLGHKDVEITITPIGSRRINIDPYPVDVSSLEIAVIGREVPDSDYLNDESLCEEYYNSQARLDSFTLSQ